MKKLILLLALIFLVSGCVNQSGYKLENVEIMPLNDISDVAGADNSETSSAQASNTIEIDVTARQWEFEPSAIEVNEGDRVILHITSEDVTHGFSLPEFNINERLEPGKTTDIEFIADRKGSFAFACSVFCGAGHSDMTGTLVVS